MKTFLFPITAMFLVASFVAAPAPAAEDQSDPLMRKKLEYAQGVLEGLSIEDYDMILKNATAMNELGILAKWFRATEPEYDAQINIFREANKDLMKYATEQNLDGASLAYMQVTLSCINCHKHIRGDGQ